MNQNVIIKNVIIMKEKVMTFPFQLKELMESYY